MCWTTCGTTNPQQIKQMELDLTALLA